jgi:hypothetical protein
MNAQWLRGFTRCPVWIKLPSVSVKTLIRSHIFGRTPLVVECARQFWTWVMLESEGFFPRLGCFG